MPTGTHARADEHRLTHRGLCTPGTDPAALPATRRMWMWQYRKWRTSCDRSAR
ncbi:hypothetical protein [Streptomyces cinerochromogenes]|uniref:hypothetical protein n=1 Tax=Streptomyces cinerochromogenes TaxID=66422 RepID=UPI0033B975E1